ncbi:bifunctional glycosyltransferase family 2/GtrA family protein [Leucobacter rhizosphaerae]|uniref:Bifunctional glycosyltransferase family 2/GtrA family protein n=1 Tax=Leucobacter rhizosphaerae TaxID=2932245 RepID=A0ABY4FXB5_9MICO|nr:bifunctional glycosyltransferase family 2/GtrA family protein [Leucobacter rhizosphaerae]UOQ60804.1 bifunctional glycosyltransferase family 2/GtrA family protein [Leucobacter rhizosphaerae]
MLILIPAYEPGDALPALVRALRAGRPEAAVLIVDDGSGPAYAHVFAAARDAGAAVLVSSRNHGKGHALKLGFAEAERTHPGADVVTADADGQHEVGDILAIADELDRSRGREDAAMVLGCRAFTGAVPLRSRLGNAVARRLFRAAAGWALSDTQTGLRGIPHRMLPWLRTVPGERFEYEQQVLLRLRRAGFGARELPIRTVYLQHNPSSHFRPVRDSLRVLAPIARFAASSLLAFVVDAAVLAVLLGITGLLVPSIVIARLTSASVNFAVNRRVVFQRRGRGALGRQIVQYSLLAILLLASNIVWMSFLTDAGVPLWIAKLTTEAVLFATSYGVQRGVVFAGPREPEAAFPENERVTHMDRIATSG